MEDDNDNIDKKYDIIDKKGSGATSVVFLVKDSTTKKIYAAKVLKKQSKIFNDEIEILNALKNTENEENGENQESRYILNLINNGTGNVVRKGKVFKEKQYIILEYASKGRLYDYIRQFNQGLKKEYAKVIFVKILRGVHYCHEKGICHRDLKLDNILLDENFNPKIADFGFATYGKGKLNDPKGTPGYIAPELYEKKKYDGYKADIFSLGVILFNLYTGKSPFNEFFKKDCPYQYIKNEDYENYWKKATGVLEGIKDLEDFENFKDLFNKMISYRPKERPTIIDILKSEWIKEIRVLNEDQKNQLEEEIIEEFLRIEPKVNEVLELGAESNPIESLNNDRGGIEDNLKKYFDLSLKPKYTKTGLGMNYIKIKGNLSPAVFMNNLANKIDQKFNCKIEQSKVALKFNITFEEELKDEEEIPKELEEKLDELDIEENEEINENLLKKECIIKCKLYQSLNGGHILKFSKKNGYLEDYYNNLEIIISLVKELLKFI